jgi:two-component system chemotaxis sensor kinase CheA
VDFANYLNAFLDESREAMQQLNDQLLQLERTPDDAELVHAIFRTVHTFKGMASTMGFDDLASVSHGMESLLDGLRTGAIALETDLVDLLLKGVEMLELLLGDIPSGDFVIDPNEMLPASLVSLAAAFDEALSRTRVVPAMALPPDPTPRVVEAPPERAPLPASARTYSVVVVLEDMCLLKSVRAMMIVSSLEMLGEVLDITPSLEELEWSDDTRQFELILKADVSAEVVEGAFADVSEVELVKVTELTPTNETAGELSLDAPVLVLTSGQRTQMTSAMAVGFSAVRIEVALMSDSLMKSVRAAMVLQSLQPFGEVVRLDPPMAQIEREEGDRFWITTLSVASPSTVRDALLGIGEVRAVSVQPISAAQVAEAPAPDALTVPIVLDIPITEPIEPEPAGGTLITAGTTRRHQTVRVSTEHLDALLGLMNELAADHARLVKLAQRHGLDEVAEVDEVVRRMGTLTGAAQGAVRELRLVAVEMVFNRFPRMVRSLSRELNKDVALVMSGQDTLLDRLVVDELGDPLVHLLRNALDHGMEPPDARLAAGKCAQGTVRLSAYQEGTQVVIEVGDDGRGMNVARILAKAVSQGLVSAAHAEQLDPESALDFVFAPGFSTAEAVTSVSGRGVGLDVVRNKITSLGGAIEVDNRPGEGTTFRIRLPLSLALVQAMLTDVGGEVYAIPMGFVEEVYALADGADHEVLPLVRLRERLAVPGAVSDQASVVVVRTPTRRVGLVVEQLLGKHEIAIKPLSRLLGDIRYLSGAAPLEDGRMALILDPGHLV